MIKLVKNENESFVKNRLIYDSGYIDFIRDLAKIEGNSSLLDILDTLNVSKYTYESSYTQIDVDAFIGPSNVDAQKNKEKADLKRYKLYYKEKWMRCTTSWETRAIRLWRKYHKQTTTPSIF